MSQRKTVLKIRDAQGNLFYLTIWHHSWISLVNSQDIHCPLGTIALNAAELRLRLEVAETPEEMAAVVGQYCPQHGVDIMPLGRTHGRAE